MGQFTRPRLVVRSAVAIVILHGLVILLWASFYRTRCFPSWELAFYFSASSYSTVGYGDRDSPVQLATLRAFGGDDRCVDVWNIGQCSVCSRHAVARSRHTIFYERIQLNKAMPNANIETPGLASPDGEYP